MAKEKRVFVLHNDVNDVDSFKKYFILKDTLDGVELVWDSKEPEYLFATEQIYSNKAMWNLFKELYSKCIISVFYTIEALSVDFNIFDIGFTYDNTIKGDRYCQVLPPEDYYVNWLKKAENDITDVEQARALLKDKQFCNFLYSNWRAHPYRDNLFFALCKYKHVDSLGRHLNNVGQKGTGYMGHSSEVVGIKSAYKFSIACENAYFPGYTTEKMLSSLEAHTIPIYFGNKCASEDVNPTCFINCMDYNSLDEVVAKVREVDENDDIWCSMISQPWYLEEHIIRKQNRRNNYYTMFKKIFNEDVSNYEFRGKGTAIYKYNDFLYNHELEGRTKQLFKLFVKKYFGR